MKTILNIRVEESIKIQIEELAHEEGISPSEYARNILNDYLGYQEEEQGDGEVINLQKLTIDCSVPFHKEKHFILLVSWLFSKPIFSSHVDNSSFVYFIKSLVEKAIIDDEFCHELRFEFLKVLNDINRYLIEPDSETKSFNFCHQDNSYTFKYSILLNEVWRLFQSS